MTPALILISALLIIAGVALAANFRLAATLAGNYLIGKRRFAYISFRHRRERLARALGCVVAAFGLAKIVGGIPGAGTYGGVAFAAGIVLTTLLWLKTNNLHGPEVPDSQAHKKLL